MNGDPILIPCEGSGCPTHAPGILLGGMCAMCGRIVLCHEDGTAENHRRDDILARIARGDFG